MNQQGADIGTQYSSVIFHTSDAQREKTLALIKELNDAKAYSNPIVTQVKPLGEFYEAEDYHREYYATHTDAPYCQIVIAPKLEKLQKKFAELLKK